MAYNYKTERYAIFTEETQEMFLKIRDRANLLYKDAGCFRMGEVIEKCTGSSWQMMACVDRLVELKEYIEITPPESAGQYRIFTRYEH